LCCGRDRLARLRQVDGVPGKLYDVLHLCAFAGELVAFGLSVRDVKGLCAELTNSPHDRSHSTLPSFPRKNVVDSVTLFIWSSS